MPKRIDNIFHQKLKFKYMYDAYERACKNKTKNKEVIIYQMDLATNLTNTLKELNLGIYQVGKYREFRIYEPKERLIQSLPFKDRVVQQWFVEEFIKPIFVPMFIKDSYACIENRGVHKAVKTISKAIYNEYKKNPNTYILKCDIAKFFYNINKEKLYKIICRKIKDKEVLKLTRLLIYNNEEKVGIPIGNYTSQYFANIYLNIFDHYVKEKLKIKHYVRYMDDMIFVLESKEKAKETLINVRKFLEEELELKLNKKTNYFKARQGVLFCGYKIKTEYILLRKENKKKIYKKVRIWNKLYDEKKLEFKDTSLRLNSWIGHAKNADSYYLIKNIKRNCKWLYEESI